MFIGQIKDVDACENRRRLFFRPSTFYLILKYMTKFGEEAERERQLLTPLFSLSRPECEADADDVRRIGSVWMKFNKNRLSEKCLSNIFQGIKFYTYEINDHQNSSFSSCLFMPINRYATLSEFDLIINNLMTKIEIDISSTLDSSSTEPFSQYDLPVRKPSASEWFPLPYKIRNRKKGTFNFFDSANRLILDVSEWLSNHQDV